MLDCASIYIVRLFKNAFPFLSLAIVFIISLLELDNLVLLAHIINYNFFLKIIKSEFDIYNLKCRITKKNLYLWSFASLMAVHNNHNSEYAVNSEAIDLFLSVKGKLAIISVAGVYRTGKSYLLNKMLLNRKSGFAVGPTINPETKGIWVWGKPLIFKNKEDEIINVLVLDSEGLGSTEEDINHDLRLFSITLLLSSSFLYNTVGAIDENALDSLGLVLRLCEHLKNENFNDFPDFNWVLRDFSLALRDKNGESLTSKEYLEACLSNQFGDTEVRNKIRNSIKQAFVNRDCYVFVRPLLDEKSLQNLD